MQGLVAFLLRRSITAILTLGVVAAITIALLQFGLCAQIDALIAQIREQIEQEIILNKIVFNNAEEREAYIKNRLNQEIERRGLSVCLGAASS